MEQSRVHRSPCVPVCPPLILTHHPDRFLWVAHPATIYPRSADSQRRIRGQSRVRSARPDLPGACYRSGFMPHIGMILSVSAAILFIVLGVAAFAVARREDDPRLSLTGIGRVSPSTFFVAALASLGMAYHIIVYAFDLRQFRAPWWLAVSVASLAVLLSLGVDAVENGRSKTDSRR